MRRELVISAPKTKSSCRSIILPTPILGVLRDYRQSIRSRWMFPSPKKEDSPLDPAAVRKKLAKVLNRADCKHIRFHDLRHTFATNALEHGMDIKTLSTIIGHVTSATTLNVYAHVTDTMRENAAASIDRGIAGIEPPRRASSPAKPKVAKTDFQPVKGNTGSRERVVSVKSTNTSGRAATPRKSTGNEWHAASTPIQRRSVRESGQYNPGDESRNRR